MKSRLLIVPLVIAANWLGFALIASAHPPMDATPTPKVYRVYVPFVARPAATKRGAAQDKAYQSCQDVYSIGASWLYNWGNIPLNCEGVESVQMCWDVRWCYSPFQSRYILGMNECDLATQCNMNPADAAVLWRRLETENPTRKLIAPSVASNFQWLVDFRAAYVSQYGAEPRMDGLQVHCYADAVTCENRVNWFAAWLNVPIWVDEYAIRDLTEARQFQDWMDANPRVYRYAWFAARLPDSDPFVQLIGWNPSLVNYNTGELTQYGAMYRK
jgi:hypothetical protein